MSADAYYSKDDDCWFVPVSAELWSDAEEGKLEPVEPARLELRDGTLFITRLSPSDAARLLAEQAMTRVREAT